MKNKYTLYLLLCALMIYFAVGKINIFANGLAGLFAIIWLLFALFVFAGNLAGLLFAPRKKIIKKTRRKQGKKSRRLHSYN